MNKIIKFTLSLSILTMSFLSFANKSEEKRVLAKVDTYVAHDLAEFQSALSHRIKDIKVDDIDFEGKSVTLNYDVSISSVDKQSTFKNVYLKVNGPNTNGESISISLSNILFDGGISSSNYDLTQEKSYEEIFESEREGLCCIDGNSGYYTLNIDSCSITNYSSSIGPALFVENTLFEDEKVINITNSKFYGNISEWDTVHCSNNKLNLTMDNCEFYNNYAYKASGFSIANGKAVVNKVNVHDNHFVKYDANTSNPQLCGGGVFIGGTDIKFTNSYIINNESTYGGGVGVTTAYSGSKDTIFSNVTIKDNKAVYGGAICAHSLVGQSLIFNNCNIINNTASEGGPLYTLVYAHWLKASSGGLVEFFFTTFALNKAEDNLAFDFYLKDKTKGEVGEISLKGCIAIGNDLYGIKEDDYNYVATKEQAILDGVISSSDTEAHIIKGSKADVKVPVKVYKGWNEIFNDSSSPLSIGYSTLSPKKSINIRALIIIAIPSVIAIVLLVVLIIILKHRKHSDISSKSENPAIETTIDERKELLNTLSEREKKVVTLTINLKKRKEIASELNYSENTIKKDLTSIYSKLKVVDKIELISKYKDLI